MKWEGEAPAEPNFSANREVSKSAGQKPINDERQFLSISHLRLESPAGRTWVLLLLPSQVQPCHLVQVILDAQCIASESVACHIPVWVVLVVFGIDGDGLVGQLVAQQSIPAANLDSWVGSGASVFSVNPFGSQS